jgi:thiamine biosynthesis lipoprotein
MKPRLIFLLLFLSLAGTVFACDARREHVITGRTMGTTYQVKVVTGRFGGVGDLGEKIEARLEAIDRSMSTYRPDSEISRFNRLDRAGEKFPVSTDFLNVMTVGAGIYRLSRGAWDATVDPLVNLWGFGSAGKPENMPSGEAVAAALSEVGFDRIAIDAGGFLLKMEVPTSVDLASIAKGYGVDQLAALVRGAGHVDFLVEIGGEVYATGRRSDGGPWRVGINTPRAEAAPNEVYRVVELSARAFATSGDYRNFFEMNGVRYSHVIDPRTGRPVSNGVVSATIIADSCTLADGLATAVMVMGPEKGLALIESLQDVEGLIVVADAGGRLQDYLSTGFPSKP